MKWENKHKVHHKSFGRFLNKYLNNNKLFSSMYKQTALFNEVYIYILKRPSKDKKA